METSNILERSWVVQLEPDSPPAAVDHARQVLNDEIANSAPSLDQTVRAVKEVVDGLRREYELYEARYQKALNRKGWFVSLAGRFEDALIEHGRNILQTQLELAERRLQKWEHYLAQSKPKGGSDE